MQVAGLAFGVISALGKHNDQAQVQQAVQSYVQNQAAQQQLSLQINQQIQKIQEQIKEEQQNELLNADLIPPYPRDAEDTASQRLRTFYNVNSAIWTAQFSALDQQKKAIFLQSHYEFSEEGNPLIESNGLPKLFQGQETAEQEKSRQAWEQEQQSSIQQNAEEKKAAFLKEFGQNYQQAIQSNMGSLTDPQVQARLRAMVSQGENQLQNFEHGLQLDILKAGLPTVELREKANELSKKVKNEEDDFLSQLQQSPEGEKLRNYQENVQQILLQQKTQLAQDSEVPAGASPGLLSTLVPSSQNQELSETVQGAIANVNRQYKTTFNLK